MYTKPTWNAPGTVFATVQAWPPRRTFAPIWIGTQKLMTCRSPLELSPPRRKHLSLNSLTVCTNPQTCVQFSSSSMALALRGINVSESFELKNMLWTVRVTDSELGGARFRDSNAWNSVRQRSLHAFVLPHTRK